MEKKYVCGFCGSNKDLITPREEDPYDFECRDCGAGDGEQIEVQEEFLYQMEDL